MILDLGFAVLKLILVAAGLLFALSTAPAGDKDHSWRVPSGVDWPWERLKFHGYPEKPPATPPPPNVTRPPAGYTITITLLPQKVEETNLAVVMAHLPEHAVLWFNEHLTQQHGMLRKFESPPLQPGVAEVGDMVAIDDLSVRLVCIRRRIGLSCIGDDPINDGIDDLIALHDIGNFVRCEKVVDPLAVGLIPHLQFDSDSSLA
jgi:hypothetical protein